MRTFGNQPRAILSVAFDPAGKTVAAGSFGAITLWDVTTGNAVKTLKGDRSIYTVAFSPDGKTLASGGAAVELWNLASGQPLKNLGAQPTIVNAVAFSPDGKTLASGSDDKTAKLLNIAAIVK
ncbi:MAG: WD40 repeat domain-containing protein [Thermomicrobiales bacterium]